MLLSWFANDGALLTTQLPLDVFKLELLLLVLSEEVAELPFESSKWAFWDGEVKFDFDWFLETLFVLGDAESFESCGIERLNGDLTGSFLITFAALCILNGEGCSIFVVFIGFAEWFVGMEEFLLLAIFDDAVDEDDACVVGLIDDNFV